VGVALCIAGAEEAPANAIEVTIMVNMSAKDKAIDNLFFIENSIVKNQNELRSLVETQPDIREIDLLVIGALPPVRERQNKWGSEC
jgi:hypothetical protein